MEKVFSWSLKDGRKAEVVVTNCTVSLHEKVLDADGFKIETGEYYTAIVGDAYLYVDDKKIAWADASNLGLRDRYFNGPYCKKIIGFPAGFDDPSLVERYETWLAGVIEEAKTDEVRVYESAQATASQASAKSADYPATVKADPVKEREYDFVYNEGGEGYNPYRVGSEPTYRQFHISKIAPDDFLEPDGE